MTPRQARPRQGNGSLWIWGCAGAALLTGILWLAPARGTAPAVTPISATPAANTPTWFDYRIVNIYPHDPEAFTQGLIYRDGFLFESTGLEGRSSLRKVKLETGEVVQQQAVDKQYFAEGLADWEGRLIQLTWQAQRGFVYDLNSFRVIGDFAYLGEGWGLARDETRLVMSDGSSSLRFLDPATLTETGRLSVTEGGRPVDRLNELEMVKGQLFANIWQSDEVAIIDVSTGQVVGRIDFRGLLSSVDRTRHVDVLNGIAYDAARNRLFVTGKLWPRLFEVELRPRS